MEMKWNKYDKENLPPEGVEVLAYNSKWVNEDFNPKGIRIGFVIGGEFISAHWLDYQDCYITISKTVCEDNPNFYVHFIDNTEPEYWCEIPKFDVLNKWICLQDTKDIYSVNEICCDTRDFYVMLRNDNIEHNNIINPLIKSDIIKESIKEDFLIDKTNIITWLKHIEKISSNNLPNVEWRYLSFNNIENNEWIKYIRFYRYNDNSYVVTNDGYKLLPWREMNETNLNQSLLCAQ